MFFQLALHLYVFKANIKLLRCFWKVFCIVHVIANKGTAVFSGFSPSPYQCSLRSHLIFKMPSAWLRVLEICLRTNSQMKNYYLQHWCGCKSLVIICVVINYTRQPSKLQNYKKKNNNKIKKKKKKECLWAGESGVRVKTFF